MRINMMGRPARQLKTGYTTGSCAAAASRGAALMLKTGQKVNNVTITLPDKSVAEFQLFAQEVSKDSASCFVIKDAGDDPDITNGAEIYSTVSRTLNTSAQVTIEGGIGIGRVTKPGLAVPPGEYAINPVPRKMIAEAVADCIPPNGSLNVIISIPNGEKLAEKTLNNRLGIAGGLSILGTTGIVRPISAKAWTDTIDASLDVARACHSETVLLSTGRTSESAALTFLEKRPINEEGCVMMGDHVAHSLRACMLRGFDQPFIACQFAKLFKIACGYGNTHAAASELDLKNFAQWAEENDFPENSITAIKRANTAREIIINHHFDRQLIALVCKHAFLSAQEHAPGIKPVFLLADYSGKIVFSS